MRFEGHITAVEDIGGELRIKMQVCESTAPACSEMHECQLVVIDRNRAARAYYVGREITITLEPGK